MATLSPDVTAAVASLQARWGAAAPRVTTATTDGALALAPATAPATLPSQDGPASTPTQTPARHPTASPAPASDERVIRTGFAALDAILGPGGLPRSASVAIRGDGSSGRTTLVHRLAAEAQAQGSIVAWLDLSRSFDPVEAVARGIPLEWPGGIPPRAAPGGPAVNGGGPA